MLNDWVGICVDKLFLGNLKCVLDGTKQDNYSFVCQKANILGSGSQYVFSLTE